MSARIALVAALTALSLFPLACTQDLDDLDGRSAALGEGSGDDTDQCGDNPDCVPEDPHIHIFICHHSPNDPDHPETLEVSQQTWPIHEAHGDTMGPCEEAPPDGPGDPCTD